MSSLAMPPTQHAEAAPPAAAAAAATGGSPGAAAAAGGAGFGAGAAAPGSSSAGGGDSSSAAHLLPRPARTRTSVAFAVDQTEALTSPRTAGPGASGTAVPRTTVNNPWALVTQAARQGDGSGGGEPEAAAAAGAAGDGETSDGGWKVIGATKPKASLIQLTQALRPKVFTGDKRRGGRAAALQRQLTVSQFAMVTAIAMSGSSNSTAAGFNSTSGKGSSGYSSSAGTSLLGGPREGGWKSLGVSSGTTGGRAAAGARPGTLEGDTTAAAAAAGRSGRPSQLVFTPPSAAAAAGAGAGRYASQGGSPTSSSRRPGGFFLEPRASGADHWELHSECHSRPYSGFQGSYSSSPPGYAASATGSWGAYTPSVTGCNQGRYGWGDTQAVTPGSPGRGQHFAGGTRSRCGSALSNFGHSSSADGVVGGTMMSSDGRQTAAGGANPAAAAAAAAATTAAAAGGRELGELGEEWQSNQRHTCGNFSSDSECPSCAAMALARRAAVDAGRSSWSGEVDKHWAHIPAVTGVDTAAAVAAHAAAADLEAAQAALLRRLLGTYALKAYKDAMKGRQGPSASALARLPTPSAEDIEQALRAAAAEEAAAAHAAAAARHSLHQTTQVGQSTAGQGAPGVTSCGGEAKGQAPAAGRPSMPGAVAASPAAGRRATADYPPLTSRTAAAAGGTMGSTLAASPGDTPGAASSASGSPGGYAGTLGRVNSSSAADASPAPTARTQQPLDGTDGSTVVPLADLAAELVRSPRMKDSQLKQLVQQLTPRGSQCHSTGAYTLVLAHHVGVGEDSRAPAFCLGSKQQMQQQHQDHVADNNNSSSSSSSSVGGGSSSVGIAGSGSCGGAATSRATPHSRLSGHLGSPGMGLTNSETLTKEDKFDLAAAAATLASTCGVDGVAVPSEAAVRPRDKGMWSTTPRSVGSTTTAPLVNRGLTTPRLRSPSPGRNSSLMGSSMTGACAAAANSSGNGASSSGRDMLTSRVQHDAPDVADTARAAAVTAAVAGLDEVEADLLTGLLTGRLTSRTRQQQQQQQVTTVNGQSVNSQALDCKSSTPRAISYTMQYSPRNSAVSPAADLAGGSTARGRSRSCSTLRSPSPTAQPSCAQPESGLPSGQVVGSGDAAAVEQVVITAAATGDSATAAGTAKATAAAAGKLSTSEVGSGTGVTSVTSRGQVLGATGKGWSPSITPRGAYQSIAAGVAPVGTANGSSTGQQHR